MLNPDLIVNLVSDFCFVVYSFSCFVSFEFSYQNLIEFSTADWCKQLVLSLTLNEEQQQLNSVLDCAGEDTLIQAGELLKNATRVVWFGPYAKPTNLALQALRLNIQCAKC